MTESGGMVSFLNVSNPCAPQTCWCLCIFFFTGLKWAGADYRLASSGSVCWELVWEGKVSDCCVICCFLSLCAVDSAALYLHFFTKTTKCRSKWSLLLAQSQTVQTCLLLLLLNQHETHFTIGNPFYNSNMTHFRVKKGYFTRKIVAILEFIHQELIGW